MNSRIITIEKQIHNDIYILMKWFFSRSLPTPKDQTQIHRKVSRLDLFFDLTYVLLFRDLFYLLGEDVSISLFGNILLYFVPAWLIRHGYNFYVQRFEENTIRHRIMTFVLMFCILLYSYAIHTTGLEASLLLIYSAIWAHLFLWYLFLSATQNESNKHISKLAKLNWRCHIFYSIVWGCGILLCDLFNIDFSVIIWITDSSFILMLLSIPYVFKNVPKVHSEHLWERFWLFIIIVLAEMIYGLIEWLSDSLYIDTTVIFIWIWGFLLTIAIRWLYFDIIWHNPITKKGLRYVTHWSLLHLPLSLCIIYLGGMFLHMVNQVSSNIIQRELMFLTWLLVLLIFLIIWLLSFFHEFEWQEPTKKYNLPKNFPGYIMIAQVCIMPLIFWALQISSPVILISILLFFFGLNIILFHYFFDPLDLEENFE